MVRGATVAAATFPPGRGLGARPTPALRRTLSGLTCVSLGFGGGQACAIVRDGGTEAAGTPALPRSEVPRYAGTLNVLNSCCCVSCGSLWGPQFGPLFTQPRPQRHPHPPHRPHQAADHEPLARSYQ